MVNLLGPWDELVESIAEDVRHRLVFGLLLEWIVYAIGDLIGVVIILIYFALATVTLPVWLPLYFIVKWRRKK